MFNSIRVTKNFGKSARLNSRSRHGGGTWQNGGLEAPDVQPALKAECYHDPMMDGTANICQLVSVDT